VYLAEKKLNPLDYRKPLRKSVRYNQTNKLV